jgi:thiol:disulfide interchange protein
MRGTIGPNRTSLLSVMGALEAATGLVLLAVPSVLVELLLGATPGTPAGVTVSRVAGAALLALGVACWLARDDVSGRAAKGLVTAMLLYNVAVVAILVLVWTSSGLSGVAFWPVVLAHSGLAAWCGACLSARTLKEKRS